MDAANEHFAAEGIPPGAPRELSLAMPGARSQWAVVDCATVRAAPAAGP